MRNALSLFILPVALCFAAGCEDRPQPGEVARINGRGITLAQLEAMQGSSFPDWPASASEDRNGLRKQYGPALTDLMALELVKQQLERKKMAVTDEEVAVEEAQIRADYPPGAFEAMLVNEGIDRESWRFLLRNKLSLQRFIMKMLRPEISISPEETTGYYREHEAEFVRPAWARFIMISGPSKELVEQAKAKLAATGDPVRLQADFAALAVRTVRMDKNRLLPDFVKELDRMRPGQFSPVIKGGDEFHVLLLLEATAERRLSPTEAYPQIEETLLEGKLHTAYNTWIQGRLAKADIKVSPHLLPVQETRQGDPGGQKNATLGGGNGTSGLPSENDTSRPVSNGTAPGARAAR